ncbi:malonic semialdehyde reductase [Occultella kanbiaonis]|uniref:malonic semialdehyde reductase n=1 Tax=Occultella kanbiaonis TaxID=2675754 RepID=UPI0013D1947A|nr:malonic semialdehyde reductase [Occultella kanbiaonis]
MTTVSGLPTAYEYLSTEAHTVSAFDGPPVTDGQLQQAYDLMKWGPTAMNITPLRILALRSAQARARLAPHMSDGNRSKTVAAPLTLVAATDTRFHAHLPVLAPHRAELAVALESAPERRESIAHKSGLIQVGYLIVALRAAGLHVGPMGGFDAAGVDTEFFSASGWRSLLVLNVGNAAAPEGVRPRAARLTFEDTYTEL